MIIQKISRHFRQLARGHFEYYVYRLCRKMRYYFSAGKEKSIQVKPLAKISQEQARHAVIVHLFYPDFLDEVLSQPYFKENQCDLFISITAENKNKVNEKLAAWGVSARLYVMENRGRDVLPFLKILPDVMSYDWVCKVHSKKSKHIVDGELWGKDLVTSLFSEKVLKLLKSADPQLQMWAPYQSLLDVDLHLGKNEQQLKKLFSILSLTPPSTYRFSFVAGTMFWFRPQSLIVFCKKTVNWNDYFTEEQAEVDGTWAHAMERLFYFVATRGDRRAGAMFSRSHLLY